MNLFKNLFGGKGKTDNALSVSVVDTESKKSDSTTVESSKSQHEEESKVERTEKQFTKISQFLNRNYQNIGLNDGYYYGTESLLHNSNLKIKSEFILVIEQMIQEKKSSILELENKILGLGGISPILLKQLQYTIECTSNSIKELDQQKELSVENEGWVMNAIHAYKEGFIKGIQLKIEESFLISNSTNLFTSKN